jgi:GAF domain-containing protein
MMVALVMESSPSRDPALPATPASSALAGSVHLSADGGAHSLAEMARRDLDAALQLLADRAQYITGASGAAIALRRHGKNDMQCRASAGSNAPELGALLSTEFGLSGESVRTRQPLRCDDAERDARVNRDVCRQLGIASVVVMPVVNDDEVLGVFELFSGKVNAFGERDLSAVQRLSEMVETAVRLAEATENLPQRLKMGEICEPEADEAVLELGEETILDGLVLQGQDLQGQFLEDVVLEEPASEKPASGSRLPAEEPASGSRLPASAEQSGQPADARSLTPEVESPEPEAESRKPEAERKLEAERKPEAPLYWSASPNPAAKAGVSEEADQSHIPPMLRSLRKCEACGFPISAGRMLCVECEEKKWRGQPRAPQAVARQAAIPPAGEKSGLAAASPAASAAAVSASAAAAGAVPEARAFAAAAPAQAAGLPVPLVPAKPPASATDVATQKAESRDEDQKVSAAPLPGALLSGASLSGAPELHPLPEEPVRAAEASGPAFVLSAGMEPAPSWISANKYVLGVVLVVVGLVVLGVFVLR